MTFRTETGTDILRAKQLLDNEEIIAIPTETVYGLAANAFSEKAINKVYTAKMRPISNPLIVHVAGKKWIYEVAHEISEKAELLIEKFMPGPLTLLLPKKKIVPDIVTSGLPNVAIRLPAHPVANKLLELLDYPLAAPSANPFGFISPTTAEHVYTQMSGKIPFILDGGKCTAGIESTIIGFKSDIPVIYRLGSITSSEIEDVVGPVTINEDTTKTVAPGMLKKHYSPRTPLLLTQDLEQAVNKYAGKKIGLLTYNSYSPQLPEKHQIVLGKTTNMSVIAHNLYSAMHTIDNGGYDLIIVNKLPDDGIGKSINDRLTRASTL